MAKCPKCKEELPLLSKICPVCGYVVEGGDDAPSAEDFANALEKCLYEIKEIPQPSFMRSMGQLSIIMLPLLAAYMLIIALISDAGLFWLLFLLFALLSIWVIVKKVKGKLGNDPFNKEFHSAKNAYEYYERTAKRNFGKSKEVTKLLSDISTEISGIEAQRNASSRKNLLIWLVIVVIFFAAGGMSVFSINKSLNAADELVNGETGALVAEGKWQEAIAQFNASSEKADEYESNNLAKEVIPVILAAGETAKAEEFFLQSCMGKVGDLECASLIVNYYKEKSDTDAAKAFIQRCTKMRYKSDRRKLEKLLK